MGLLDFIRNLALGTVLSILVLAAVGTLCAVALVALRFLRRGAARFWLAAGYVALALVPIALGTALSGWRVGILGSVLGLIESGPSVAMRAGLNEALVPLFVGLLIACGLALLGFVLLAVGRRTGATAKIGTPAAIAPVMALALVLATLALTSCIPLAGRALAAASDSTVSLARTALLGGLVCAVVAAVAGILLPLRSPRGAAPVVVRALALASPVLLGLIAVAGAIAGAVWLASSHRAAVGGVPLGEPAGELYPAVDQPWGEPELAAPMPPPPPPPTPRATSPEALEHAPARRSRAAEGIDSTERPAAAAPEAASASSPMRIGGRIKEPRKLRNVNPVYPAIARQARVQGIVILECAISPQGKVTDVKLLRSIPLLDQAAIDAVKQWEYEPTLLNGVPVPVIMTVTVRFRLS